jgi:hypothetical protein
VRPGEVVFVFPADRDADFDLLEDRRLPAPAEVGAPGPGDESNGATEPGVSG